MKLSVYTPTHSPIYLYELYESLTNQTKHRKDWEWIIVPNGKATELSVPANIRTDERVRIVQAPKEITGIGALKKFACAQTTGDILIEADHDDWLAPDAFASLVTAHEKVSNGFYYSDFINLREDGTCETYSSRYGWSTYKTTINGKEYTACRAFPANARGLCQIFFAPNHIRAWSRQAYALSGGYDDKLAVGDDHDLLCRTFIAGVPFVWIEKPLYIYRRTKKQSFLEFNKEIQVQQQVNCNKYIHQLIFEECNQNQLPILDLGRKNWASALHESFDIVDNCLVTQLPFQDNTIGCVKAFDCLQHIPSSNVVAVMNEIHRILMPGGWLLTSTPSVDDGEGRIGRGAFQDPNHKSFWSLNSLEYFCNKPFAEMLKGYTGRFQNVRSWIDYPSDWHKQKFIPYVYADFCALKGQRQPGETFI